ncbi:MAG: DUF429 domain-containing protein [Hadesarchaea archaeon]|nr:DUF429 domain-containing protein [Hadesarchaea archaeon]
MRIEVMIIGVDLAGKEDNPTGVSILDKDKIDTLTIKTDSELLEICKSNEPKVIAIDSPLSFPKNKKGLRKADSELVSRGHKVLPPGFGGMRFLTERGIQLAKKLRKQNLKVIEVHPRTSGKILFNSSNREDWIASLKKKEWDLNEDINEHEVDAILAALTGLLYLKGKVEKVGEEGEKIIIPKKNLDFPESFY